MKLLEFLDRDDNRSLLIVSSISIAIIFVIIILFSAEGPVGGRFPKSREQREANFQQVSNLYKPAASTRPLRNLQPSAQTIPDTVTSATPRLIAWLNTVVEQIKPAVVGICVGDTKNPSWQQGWEVITPSGKRSIGSGVIVMPDGYIITNYHVIELGQNIVVSLFDANGYKEYVAKLISGDKKRDLALLKITSNESFPYALLGDSNKISVGDNVIAIGNPFGLSQTVTAGIISAKREKLPVNNVMLNNLFQTDVPINPGNSGGALVNLNGELIGITTAIFSPTGVYTGISFAIPINTAKRLFSKYIKIQNTLPLNYKFVKNVPEYQSPKATYIAQKIQPSPGEGIEEIAWLGIDINPTNEVGVLVDEIEGISPMEAGLQAGDIIKAVNGKKFKDIYEFKDVIKTIPLSVNQGIVLDVYRSRQNRSLYISFRLKEWDLKGR